MGTVENIFILNSPITHCLNNNKRLYCTFVDFTKAFDYIVRDILWFRQGECLSPFLFSMYLNKLEAELATKDLVGIAI